MRIEARSSLILTLDAAVALLCVYHAWQLLKCATLPVTLGSRNYLPVVIAVDTMAGGELKIGDKISTIDGLPVANVSQIEIALDGKKIGETATLEIRRDTLLRTLITPLGGGHGEVSQISADAKKNVSVKLTPKYNAKDAIVMALASMLFLALGVFVWIKRPNDQAALMFHWTTTAAAVSVAASSQYQVFSLPVEGIAHLVSSLAFMLAPVLFVHFTYLFPSRKLFGQTLADERRNWQWLYGISMTLSICSSAAFCLMRASMTEQTFQQYALILSVNRWGFAIGMMAGIGNFVRSYIEADDETERRKLRWILLGLLTGPLSFVLLWALPKLLAGEPAVSREIMLLLSALTPLTFAIAIVRYRAMNIDLLFSRSAVYGMALAFSVGVYALFVSFAAVLVGNIAEEQKLLTPVIAAVLVALLFEPARKRLQQIVDKQFFRVQYNYREAQRQFLDDVKSCYDVQALASLVVKRMNEFLMPKRVAVFTLNAEKQRLHAVAQRGFKLAPHHGIAFKVTRLDLTEKTCLKKPTALERYIEQGVPIEPAQTRTFERWQLVLACPMLSEEKQLLGLLAVGEKQSEAIYTEEDVDLLSFIAAQTGLALERIELQKELLLKSEEAKRLKELSEMKSYFISGVSHDLRTPLTSIRLFAELLESDGLEKEQAKDYLSIIQGETERLERLIENVLTFAKQERGVKSYQMAELDVARLAEQVLERFAYYFETQKVTLHKQISTSPLLINGDADRLTEALENLLVNAVKYSPEHKEISFELCQKQNAAVVKISDKGIGIASDELDKIFEPFYRSTDEKAKQVGGTGLGLSLVKHTIEAHRGTIAVESSLGNGSCFTLTLPLAGTHTK